LVREFGVLLWKPGVWIGRGSCFFSQ
jgi:hypothetical protein